MQTDQEKLALVTGAAGVLGLAISRALVADGYRVIMVDLNQTEIKRLAEAIGDSAIPLALDISAADKVKAASDMI